MSENPWFPDIFRRHRNRTISVKLANLTHLFPMQPFSNERFFDILRRLRKGALGANGLMPYTTVQQHIAKYHFKFWIGIKPRKTYRCNNVWKEIPKNITNFLIFKWKRTRECKDILSALYFSVFLLYTPCRILRHFLVCLSSFK